MIRHKLSSEDFEDYDYHLIAIHTTLEDFRLAFYINQLLPIRLVKHHTDVSLQLHNEEYQFSRFFFDDENQEIIWQLVQNKKEMQVNAQAIENNLFFNNSSTISSIAYLVPELNKVDYFLKIENGLPDSSVDEVLKSLKNIRKVSTVYAVEPEQLKSKNNLIF